MKKKYAIFTIMIGKNKSYSYVENNFEYYAKKIDADLIICKEENFSKSYSSSKTYGVFGLERIQILELLNHYERVLCLDSDIIIHPEAPNIFENYPDDNYMYLLNEGLVFDRSYLLKKTIQILNENEILKHVHTRCTYYNVGVILFSKKQREFFEKINFKEIEKIIFDVNYFEQTYFNYLFMKYKFKVKELDHRFNWMDMFGRRSKRLDAHFIYYAGFGFTNRKDRKYELMIDDLFTFYSETLNGMIPPKKNAYYALRRFFYKNHFPINIPLLNYF